MCTVPCRSVTAVTLLQLGMMAINGYFNAFMWNKAPFFGTLLLPSLLSIFFVRGYILRAVLCASFCHL
jgi:hypothetical protein